MKRGGGGLHGACSYLSKRMRAPGPILDGLCSTHQLTSLFVVAHLWPLTMRQRPDSVQSLLRPIINTFLSLEMS